MAQSKHYPAWNEVVVFGSNGPTHKTLIETDSYKAVLVGLEAGVKIPPHPAAAAAYHFLEGSGWMSVGDEQLAVKHGETVVVPAGVPRGVEAETRLSFLGSHGVAGKEKRRPSLKMGLPMMLGAMLMFGLMLGWMIVPTQMMSRIGGLGLGMWGVMLVPFLGMAAMLLLMLFVYRRMVGNREMPAMMMGHSHAHAQSSQSAENTLTILTFTIPSVNCGNCKMTIENAVSKMPGVASINVDVETKQAMVKFDLPATQVEIESVLTEIGHPPRGITL